MRNIIVACHFESCWIIKGRYLATICLSARQILLKCEIWTIQSLQHNPQPRNIILCPQHHNIL
jgi:hypothetical protein